MSDCKHPTLLPITATCAECEMGAHQIIRQGQERIATLESEILSLREALVEEQDQTSPHWLQTANHYKHKFESLESTNSELEARISALEKVAEAAVRMWNSDGLTDALVQSLQNAGYSVEIGEHL